MLQEYFSRLLVLHLECIQAGISDKVGNFLGCTKMLVDVHVGQVVAVVVIVCCSCGGPEDRPGDEFEAVFVLIAD